jgi:TatD DNase family protein
MSFWIDTHCHLDAAEFGASAPDARALAASRQVRHAVIPAVAVANFDAVRQLAHSLGDSYALGIHPLYVKHAREDDLLVLDEHLSLHKDDPQLVAVGEIGLDFFVPELKEGSQRERQLWFYQAQLKLARKHGLPVILHVRRSADALLKGLRDVARSTASAARPGQGSSADQSGRSTRCSTRRSPWQWSGIAHAFNGSAQQAQAFIELGFKLGFGGALTYPRALQLRRLASTLPISAIVLETDAPDMPPQWLYTTAAQRAAGLAQEPNSPAELPRIASRLAELRDISPQALALATSQNAMAALPRLQALLKPTSNQPPVSKSSTL